eukprot:4559147-Pyramimonas_sp.AAC.1
MLRLAPGSRIDFHTTSPASLCFVFFGLLSPLCSNPHSQSGGSALLPLTCLTLPTYLRCGGPCSA